MMAKGTSSRDASRAQDEKPSSDTTDVSDGASADPAGPDATPLLNKQIVDAVKTSTDFVFGLQPKSDGTRISAGAAIAYEKAAQAAALAVQDAEDYQRNVLSISTVAQGKALALMFAEPANIDTYAKILVLAIVTSVAATLTAGVAGVQATYTLTNVPRA